MNAHDDGSARARFRVVAPVGRAPGGARWTLTSDTFAQSFRDAFAGLEVQVADTLGGGATRTLTWSPRGLSDLTLGGVIRADATLSALAELAKATPRSIDAGWLEKLIAIVGEGTLARECRDLLEPAPPPSAEPEPPASGTPAAMGEKDEIEALFERAEAASKPAGASAVDAFVQAMRGSSGTSPSKSAASPDLARRVRDHVERAVFGVARAALEDPTLVRMESSWRALRWFVEQSPASSGVRLEIIDAPSERALELLQAIPYDGDFEDPDLFAVVAPIPDVAALRALAAFAEERLAPCIVTYDSGRDADQLLDWLGTEHEARQELQSLRADEASRWLCVAHNEVVLFGEGVGELARTVLGSPVWALLASIAASYRATGSFARIVGQAGQLRAPATTTLESGRDAGTALPTRHFTSIRAQSELEKHGVLALGSPRNSDRIALSSAPMMRAATDAVPLPAQIWAGRIARFTEWVRVQLPADASSDTAREIFEQAASVFLYPGAERSAMLTAEIVETGGRRTLQVGARIHSSHALVPLDLEFAVPLA